ncbi:uncharacterized protein SCHCODRAFT_02617829 [Schizophyllum commune H4-8]|nr:uncharacterized protein SCHCODRAFT_02617829 [Schizophyllum commune H4-8]KAI5894802.1 hypothetical protein SCHCODRAFT_02617829 [Schizophyllum commune H4-8]
MGPILWILHFFLDVLQACVLQDLPAVARYVVLSEAAVAVLALAFYALAPPTILQYCEQAQDEARSLLAHSAASPSSGSGPSPGTSDAGDTQDGPLSIMISRLNALNEERSTIQHAVWDLSDSPISRVLLSCPWFFKALKLLYSYHVICAGHQDFCSS